MSSNCGEEGDQKSNSSTVMEKDKEPSPYSDPVYHKISLMNGKINQMSHKEIQQKAKQFKLDSIGGTDILRKRLKTFFRKQYLMRAQITDTPYVKKCPHSFLCVIDFEATCEASNGLSFPHEIIEFPAILVDTTLLKIVDTFQEYVRPLTNPILSDFCKELTGISQEVVNKADSFTEVLERFNTWLGKHRDSCGQAIVIVTDGPWDMGRFLSIQCSLSGIPFPDFGKRWINIRKSYSNFYKTKRLSLANMLEVLGMIFEGQPHSGYDDAINIARIVIQMLKDGCALNINERLNCTNVQQKGRKTPPDMSQLVIPVNNTRISARCRTSSQDNGNRAVNEAAELLSKFEVDPSISGTEAVLLKHKHLSKNPFTLSK